MSTDSNPFEAETRLLSLSPSDHFTLRNAFEGIAVFGAIGAGKTSGSGRAFAEAYLNVGMGGLVLCAKKDERETWEEYADEAGRGHDLLIMSATSGLRFNFLDYEAKHGATVGPGLTENIVRLFSTIIEATRMQKGQGKGDDNPFWQDTLKQLIRNAVTVLTLAEQPVTLSSIRNLIEAAPREPHLSAINVVEVEQGNLPKKYKTVNDFIDAIEDQATKEAAIWQRDNYLLAHLDIIHDLNVAGHLSDSDALDYVLTHSFWTVEYPNLDERTRSIILTMFTSVADLLARGLLREIFSTTTNITPEAAFRGKIIVLDLNVAEYGEIGKIAATIVKYMFQKAVLRRTVTERSRPVFIWADEAQNFISPYDTEYQAMCRSQRGCTVYLSQNIPLYETVIGSGYSRARLNSFLGNLQTKIFHQNGDYSTNEWASNLFGKDLIQRQSFSTNTSRLGAGGQVGTQTQDSWEDIVPAITFTRLRKGGPQNDKIVEAIVYKAGEVWNHKEKDSLVESPNYLKVSFKQRD